MWYGSCNDSPCTCRTIAAMDPSMTHPKNRAFAEVFLGTLPTNEVIIRNYEARYGQT